jgi:hypothetical protein
MFLREKKWKVINSVLLILSLLLILVTKIYLSEVCLEAGDCNNLSRRGMLVPLENAGIILSLIFAAFLFFPQEYFKRYLARWFWWLLLIAYSITLASKPVGGSIVSLDRSQVVIVLGGVILLQAAYFIYRQKNR